MKLCKKKLQIPNPPQELSLSTTDDGPLLQPDDAIPVQNTAKTPLFIIVIDELADSRTPASDSNLKPPHPKRKERWEKLNAILEQNRKKRKDTDSTAYYYAYVPWSQVKDILKTTPYIPDAHFNILSQYLSITTKCFGPVTSGKESQRLHLIAHIIICVCFLFNGDVQIEVEEDLNGNFLKAHGHFEFVLRRGDM